MVIGCGVLSLPWCVAQLGWIVGVTTLLIFACITFYTSNLLADCYRSPDPITGKRNYTYMKAVRANLGGTMYLACGLVQYANLCGVIVGFTVTASISMVAIQKSNCFHREGHEASCSFSCNRYIICLGMLEIFLSQIPNFHKLSWLSGIAAIMSFTYAFIGSGLAFAKVISGKGERTTLTGVEIGVNLSTAQKTWTMFRAIGDIAAAYSYSLVLVEVQDTLKSSPPENKVMKKANMIGVSTTTAFYMLCGCLGYAAFGNSAPGNMLTGFGFYEPFWLVDLANFCIVVHLVGAYQVFAQAIFSALETWANKKWPDSKFVTGEYPIIIGKTYDFNFNINFLRLTWRTLFVVVATVLAMAFPFFNDILALLGAIGYWPLTVYFPIQMYIAQKKIERKSIRWLSLELLNFVCFLVAVAAASGSIQGLGQALRNSKPFQF